MHQHIEDLIYDFIQQKGELYSALFATFGLILLACVVVLLFRILRYYLDGRFIASRIHEILNKNPSRGKTIEEIYAELIYGEKYDFSPFERMKTAEQRAFENIFFKMIKRGKVVRRKNLYFLPGVDA